MYYLYSNRLLSCNPNWPVYYPFEAEIGEKMRWYFSSRRQTAGHFPQAPPMHALLFLAVHCAWDLPSLDCITKLPTPLVSGWARNEAGCLFSSWALVAGPLWMSWVPLVQVPVSVSHLLFVGSIDSPVLHVPLLRPKGANSSTFIWPRTLHFLYLSS
jgi:hypothetical protein